MAEGGVPADSIKAPTNTRDITKCSKCQYRLQDPKTLLCLHSYCNHCLETINETATDRENGFECPQCQRFTPDKSVRVVPFLVQLIVIETEAAKSKGKTRKCERCGTKDAKWFCAECKKKNWFCNECKSDHDDFVEHKVVPSDKANQDELLFNKPIYCTTHVHTVLEYYCWPCKTCLCVKCKIEDHLSHNTDPLNDVLQNDLLPTVNESLDDIRNRIKIHRDKARDIEKEKEAAIDEFNKRIRQEENKVNEHSETSAWIQTVLAKMKGANLLAQFCQDGILERVNQMTCSKAETEFRIHASRLWPWGRNTKTIELKHSVKLQNSQRTTYPFTRISFVWNTIWMINHTGLVYRYNTDGDQLGGLQLKKSITKPRTVVALNSKSGIITAESGLYMINKQGELKKKIAPGDFSDVCMVDDIVHGLEYRQGKVVSYENGKDDLQKKNEILLENYENETLFDDDFFNTFVLKNESIYVAMCYNDLILHYDIIGKKRSVIASDKNSFYPSVGGINKDNQLLVTNRRTKAVDWMSIEGTSDKAIDELPFYPWFAIYVDKSKVLVVGDDKGVKSCLYIYNHNLT